MIVIIISMLIKLGAAPFSYWVADVYSGLRTSRTMIISTIGKIAIIIFIKNIIESVGVSTCIGIVIIMSLIIGSVGGLSQYRIKRVIGYSSIAHLGWMLIGESGLYVYQYFIGVMIILALKSSSSMITSFFSLMGMPPLIGFYGKLEVLYSNMVNGEYIIVIVMIITSVISAGYYLRMIMNLYSKTALNKKGGELMVAILTGYQIGYFIL